MDTRRSRSKARFAAGLMLFGVIVLASMPALAGPKGEGKRSEAHARNDDRKASSNSGGAGTTSSHGDTRGASPSQPDQDGTGMDRGLVNGNDDKPASGDGNNGCGNDADREDDNNGWCGNKDVGGVTVNRPVIEDDGGADVLGTRVERPDAAVLAAGAEADGLATTGSPLLAFMQMASGLMTLGAVMLLAARIKR